LRVYDGASLYQPNRIFLKMRPPAGLGPKAVWTVKLEVLKRGGDAGVMKKYEYKPDDEYDNAYLSSNDELAIVSQDTTAHRGQTTMSARWGKVKVKGEIKLDVYGDGSSFVIRAIDENLDLSW